MAANTYFCPGDILATKKDIVFHQDMEFLYLDMPSFETPTNSMFQAKSYIQDIYDLILFTHRVFRNHKISSHMYILQREGPCPCEKLLRYEKTDGNIVIAAFSKEEFNTHFPTICRAAVAVNNGFKTKDSLTNLTTSLDDLTKLLPPLNAKDGTFISKEKTHPKETVGHFKVIGELDQSIEQYHNDALYNTDGTKRRNVCADDTTMDSNEMWLERARLLSWEYYLKQSGRIRTTRKILISFGQLLQRRRKTFWNARNTTECLNELAREADDDHPLTDMFRMHVDWLNWEFNVRQDTKGNTILNLKEHIAFDISQYYRFDFYSTRFLMVHADQDTVTALASHGNLADVSKLNRKQWLSVEKAIVTQFCNKMNRGMNKIKEWEAESLYAVLDKLSTYTFNPIAKHFGKEGTVCGLYQDPSYQRFLKHMYITTMTSASTSIMSRARKEQYKTLDKLTGPTMFSACSMNTLLDTEGHRKLMVFSSDRRDVDPIQDAMANHFLQITQTSGVRQLSVELIVMLLANIWSFTPMEKKPIIFLDSTTKSDISDCASVAKVIMCWKNCYGGTLDNYENFLHGSYPEEEDKYDGTRIIEEWPSKPKKRDASRAYILTKQLYENDIYTSHLVSNSRSKHVVETFRKIFDNRTTVILTNGFQPCESIADCSLFYKVPALDFNRNSCSLEEKEERLNNASIPAHFALVRHLISDQLNRDYLNLSLKASDSEKILSTYETELALERVSFVLREMGLTECKLTPRKKQTIEGFALILAHYRAVFEVFGCVTKVTRPRRPIPGETLCDYNDYLATVIQTYLERKTRNQRDILLAQRVVVDPSDIITASTLLLPLAPKENPKNVTTMRNTKSTARLFVENCLCENMTDFQSVMYFDRELTYNHQKEEDPINFVNVSEVAQNGPSGKLPEWETECVSYWRVNQDVYSEVLSSITVKRTKTNGFTFKPGHRDTHLALKWLYSSNMMNQLIHQTNEEATTRSERNVIFTENLSKQVSHTIEKELIGMYHPLIQSDQRLACDVYDESHPFTRLGTSPMKRQAEDCDAVQGKRFCISDC